MPRILLVVVAILALARCGRDAEPGPVNPLGDPAKSKFSWLSANVFTPQCNGCHNDAHAAAKVNLSTYDKATTGLVIVAGKPEASSLYAQVASGKMPKNGARLPDDALAAIYTWIKNGAQND